MDNWKKKKNKEDDSGLSRNHSKSIRYRLRIQQDLEAAKEIEDYEHEQEQSGINTVYPEYSRDVKPFL